MPAECLRRSECGVRLPGAILATSSWRCEIFAREPGALRCCERLDTSVKRRSARMSHAGQRSAELNAA